MPSDLEFEANDKRISEVLFGQLKFKIPRFQRPYAWGEDQIIEFWNDLTNNSEPYFLGSFILNYEEFDETGFVDVIDGQQRLLTLTILMGAIRNITKLIDQDLAKRIQRQDIAIEDRDGNQFFRILCGESTQEFFEKNIQLYESSISEATPSTVEEKLIKSNYEYFFEKITNEINRIDEKAKQIKFLNDLRKKVSDLIVIHIKIWSEEDAYEIFETTNARGVDLNIADLLKNLIFKNIPPTDDKDLAKEIWQNIVNNVETAGFDIRRFIRYYWISKYSFVTEKKLFKEIKKEIKNWGELLYDLWDHSEVINLLFVGDESDWRSQPYKDPDKLREIITAINNMGVVQCFVFFMSVFRNYESLGLNPAYIFDFIEKFTFHYSAVCKLPGNRVEGIYSNYARKLEGVVRTTPQNRITRSVQSLFTELQNQLIDEKPPEDYFKDKFNEIKYRRSSSSRIFIKYLLSKINNFFATTDEFKIDFVNVNIEHVLPKKPSKKWGLTKDEIHDYVDQLGNLTLLDKRINSSIGNDSLNKKIEGLSKSQLQITKMLVEKIKNDGDKWDLNSIKERQNEMANLAFREVWKIIE